MSLKTFKIIGIFIIFFLCFPLHFANDYFDNLLMFIFAPINESIYEHMKLITTSFYIYSIIEYIFIKINNIKVNNFILNVFISPLISVILYLIIYIPLFLTIGESMFISLGLLFIIIIVEQIISYKILNYKEIKNQKIIGLIGIMVLILTNTYLSFNPPSNFLFKDN